MFKLGKEEALIPHYSFAAGKIIKIYPLDKVSVNNEVISRLRIDIGTETNNVIECAVYRKTAEAIGKYLYVGRSVKVDTILVIRASAKNPGELEYLYRGMGPILLE